MCSTSTWACCLHHLEYPACTGALMYWCCTRHHQNTAGMGNTMHRESQRIMSRTTSRTTSMSRTVPSWDSPTSGDRYCRDVGPQLRKLQSFLEFCSSETRSFSEALQKQTTFVSNTLGPGCCECSAESMCETIGHSYDMPQVPECQ